MPKKNYLMPVYNAAAGKFETVSLNEQQYNAVRRGEWGIENKDRKFYRKSILFSDLIMRTEVNEKDDGPGISHENFHEFKGPDDDDPQVVLDRRVTLDVLAEALSELDKSDLALILALFVHEKTEREYAKELGENQSKINRRKTKILKMLRGKIDA